MAKLLLIDDDTEVLSINKKYFMKITCILGDIMLI